MKDLSYHVLDIANNSVRGKAKNIWITINEAVTQDVLSIEIKDDGVGIPPQILKDIKNPYTTSRTMRKVGLGIPFLNDSCVFCEGQLQIQSQEGAGTTVRATMKYSHIDRPPLGNISSTVSTLISSESAITIWYHHIYEQRSFQVNTAELREILGDMPLSTPAVIVWLKQYIKENIEQLRTEA